MHVFAPPAITLVVALAACVLAATPVQAQSHTVPPRDSTMRRDSVPRRVEALGTVRVTAKLKRTRYTSPTISGTKTTTPLRDLPQTVTVVTRELMRDQAMQNMADVVRYIPGITMGQGEGNRDQPTIRGNASTADFFVDGVRDDVQYFRDLYNIERVEALKGSNAMLFGRGGGGGVLNRVTKEAQWMPTRELTLLGGSFDSKRAAVDIGQGLTHSIAARLNAVYENSGMFRDGVRLTRYGVNPTMTIIPGGSSGGIPGGHATRVTLGYEYFSDHRTADRGIPSFQGRPISTDIGTFFGNPDVSYADVSVNAADATVSHETRAGVKIRNHARLAWYDKIYQNVFPGAVNVVGDRVMLSAYNHATPRRNLFNQTDLTYNAATGSVRHALLMGVDVGRQDTDNFRNTGYFNSTSTSTSAPTADPTVFTPVSFRQSAADADNHVTNTVGSLYAQDQITLSPHWQLITGLRYERFDVRYYNNRTGSKLSRDDHMISPRLGLLFKPVEPLSFYASHSVSYLPSAGDQFSSLTDVTKALEPERFTNYEIGAKWDVADRLALTTALYRLDRTNTRSPDPRDPTLLVQTGSQRTNGFELGVSGNLTPAWSVAGGYSQQDAFITSTTAVAPIGARVALVPRNTLSLWNRYQVARMWGVGLGIVHQADMYAAIDDKVTLPSFTEVDGALYMKLGRHVQAQMNVENLFDVRYYRSANGNNNITPGSPRAVRLSLTTAF